MMIKVATAVLGLLVAFAMAAQADTLKSKDGTLQLTVPNGWRESTPLGPAIKIQATSGRGAVVMVRTVPKEDFVDFKSFANAGVARLKKNMPDAEPKLEDIKINGMPSIRVSFIGTQANGLRKGYILTFLDVDGMFIDVITSAHASAFEAEKQAMEGMAAQLKVVAGTTTASPPVASPAPAAPGPPTPRAPR
jgi:hypothetical protein